MYPSLPASNRFELDAKGKLKDAADIEVFESETDITNLTFFFLHRYGCSDRRISYRTVPSAVTVRCS